MADLRTSYMGIPLANPIIVGACSLSKKIDTIKQVEESGAAALVIKSLFEEQIQLEQHEFDNRTGQYDNAFAEALTYFPKMEHAGPKEHLYWIKETRKSVKMPLIGSLNCINGDTWVEWARQLEDTGIDGIELNFYSPPMNALAKASDIEKREIETLAKIRATVKKPISVKLHPYYTNLLNTVSEMEKAGANSVVLFNRLFQPDINVDKLEKKAAVTLSSPSDHLLALRWAALLHGRTKAEVIASGGISSGRDVAKLLLAGAQAVQIVSVLYRNNPKHTTKLLSELEGWMAEHNFKALADFRGILGKKAADDLWSFERGQYIQAILGFD